MGVVQLPDVLQRAVDQQVAEGRAASSAAFVEEAILRLIDDAAAEEEAIRDAAGAGVRDAEAGRYTVVATPGDQASLHARLMARLAARLAADE